MIPAFIKWNVDPVLFRIGSYEMQWYSILLLLGFYISYLFLDRIFDREGVSKSIMHSSGVFIVLGLFGKIYSPEFTNNSHLDLAGILHLLLNFSGNLAGQKL